jgi:hypothetical protein
MIAGTFNEWFTLSHRTRTSDGQGGWTEAYVDYAGGTAGGNGEHARLTLLGKAAGKSQEMRMGPQLEEWVSHMFFCRMGVAIERGDRITDSRGVRYLVLGVREPSHNHIEAECREVQHGQ